MEMDLFDEFVDAVLDLMRTARRTGGAAHTVRGDGVSVPQLVVLGAVDAAGEQGVTAVAERAGLAQPTVTRALAALERRHLVLRAPHASDGRTTSLALTPGGRAVLEETMRNVVGRFGELWESLAADEREQAVRLLRSLTRITAELT
jgi:DNA-binding MarR family transcriptional regulator